MQNLLATMVAMYVHYTDPNQHDRNEKGDVVQTVLMVVLGVTIAGLVSAAIIAFVNGKLPLIS